MKKKNIFVRVNGRGNAWPVFLGAKSNFYDSNSAEDLSSTSFSLLECENENFSPEFVKWEVLIDAGHHTVPFLIKNGNRIPQAIILTHGHMDHTLGIDWVAQSSYYLSGKKKKYPLYATKSVWEFVKQSYPHLQKIINYKELEYGHKNRIDEVKGLNITAFPVYHGPNAVGASMLFFEFHNHRALFTGDMLCPLLRKSDYDKIKEAGVVYIDSNNRFPYPLSNHGSIVDVSSITLESNYISDWLLKINLSTLLFPHLSDTDGIVNKKYMEEINSDYQDCRELPFSIFSFVEKIQTKHINLIHYGGMEDAEFYNQMQLNEKELKLWVEKMATKHGLENKKFYVPQTGDIFTIK